MLFGETCNGALTRRVAVWLGIDSYEIQDMGMFGLEWLISIEPKNPAH